MSNNPFQDHGVEFLSPTSINKFRKNPAKWLVNVAGYKDKIFSPPMTYGSAVEVGITHGLLSDATTEDCVDRAINCIDETHADMEILGAEQNIEFDYDFDACLENQKKLFQTIDKVLPTFQDYGELVDHQKRVEFQIDDLPIPIIGYVDLLYDDCVRDIKVTKQKPKTKRDWEYQLTFYSKATGKKPFVDAIYSLKTKTELFTFEVQNIEEHWKDIQRIAYKMMRLLSLSENIEDVCYLSCLEPDTTNEDWWNQWGTNEMIGAKKLFLK